MAAALQYSASEVNDWNSENVGGWLKFLGATADTVDCFHGNDIDGKQLLELDQDLLDEMEVSKEDSQKILKAIETIKSNKATSSEAGNEGDWESDSDEGEPEPAQPAKAKSTSKKPPAQAPKSKKNDPLRVAARSKAVSDLQDCTVCSGWLYKTGSGIKLRSWKRRYFVLTDDNCLYYFKSPKDMSALGMVLLPSYTITKTDKSDGVSRQYSFKAFNREHQGARTFLFAAESEQEMKTWMNVMSLASIAFGSGKLATSSKSDEPELLTEDQSAEMQVLQMRAADRAGGVTGDDDVSQQLVGQGRMRAPSFVTKAAVKRGSKGPVLCLIKLLDGQTLQLYAENSTTGQSFLDQICTMLKAYERYYFGLMYLTAKGEPDWVQLDKRILKQEIPRTGEGHINLEFRIRFYPVDVTQVLQYVTLYQAFLAARHSILAGELNVSNKDAFMLASLSLQATRGDYDEDKHTPEIIAKETLIPERNVDDIVKTSNIKVQNLSTFWAEEVIRVWKTLRGILRHLAVLKYMQLAQKHPRFAMQTFDIKNKNGTALILGVNPRGLFVFRLGSENKPVVSFSWSECSELCFTDKKFTIQVHDKSVKPFAVYTTRSKMCQQILDLCVGLHRLYVQTIQRWANPPEDMRHLREQAVQAALAEREELKKDSQEARRKAREYRKEKQRSKQQATEVDKNDQQTDSDAGAPANEQAESSSAAAPSKNEETLHADSGETVIIKGRKEAVDMLDMMMADEEFMRFQEEIMADFEQEMMQELEQGGRLRSQSFIGNVARGGKEDEGEDVEVCDSESLPDRVKYIQTINTV